MTDHLRFKYKYVHETAEPLQALAIRGAAGGAGIAFGIFVAIFARTDTIYQSSFVAVAAIVFVAFLYFWGVMAESYPKTAIRVLLVSVLLGPLFFVTGGLAVGASAAVYAFIVGLATVNFKLNLRERELRARVLGER